MLEECDALVLGSLQRGLKRAGLDFLVIDTFMTTDATTIHEILCKMQDLSVKSYCYLLEERANSRYRGQSAFIQPPAVTVTCDCTDRLRSICTQLEKDTTGLTLLPHLGKNTKASTASFQFNDARPFTAFGGLSLNSQSQGQLFTMNKP